MKTVFTLLFVSSLLAFAPATHAADRQTAIFAGGCFWCVESDFESVAGVVEAVSGYIGGSAKTAHYKQVSRGGTGHFEAVQIHYDPKIISYEKLMDIFWHSVDVVDAGGQFCDRGDSYKTAIFALDDVQLKSAEASKKALDANAGLPVPVATHILKAGTFYPAEEYHQDYYKQSALILSRYGPISKKKAYKKYREACGRDARVRQLWGNKAFVALVH